MKLEALPIFPKLTVESRNLSSVTIRKNGALKASVPVNGEDIMAPWTVSMLKCSIIQDIASQILLFLPSLHIFASQFILIPSYPPVSQMFQQSRKFYESPPFQFFPNTFPSNGPKFFNLKYSTSVLQLPSVPSLSPPYRGLEMPLLS